MLMLPRAVYCRHFQDAYYRLLFIADFAVMPARRHATCAGVRGASKVHAANEYLRRLAAY